MNRGVIVPLTLEGALARARGACGTHIRYRLNYPNGGADPRKSTPAGDHEWNEEPVCDCAGFICWTLGMDRVQPSDHWPFHVDEERHIGYINCDSMIWDADGPRHFFEDATKTVGGPQKGDIIVFPSKWTVLGRRPGHVGILSGRGKVIHCSKGNDTESRRRKDSPVSAIAETGPEVFYKFRKQGLRWLRYKNFVAGVIGAPASAR